jgi:hypothetical protein
MRMATDAARLDDLDLRGETRDPVAFPARAIGADARELSILIANLSPSGLMARCDRSVTVGERLRIVLPVIGVAIADVRWAQDGRIGCRMEQTIDRATYYELVAAVIGR